MPWTISVNDSHTGGPGCCDACDARPKWWRGRPGNAGKFAGAGRRDPISPREHAEAATPHIGAPPEPMANEEIKGEYETGGLYELTVNPTAPQMTEIMHRSSRRIANINVLSRRDFAAATYEDMTHYDIHEAMTQHAHALATQERRRKLEDRQGRWQAVGRPGRPVKVLNANGFPIARIHWPQALLSAIPEGLVLDSEGALAEGELERPEREPDPPKPNPSFRAEEARAASNPRDKPLTAEPIPVEQPRDRSKSIHDRQTIDIKFIDANGSVDINFPPDWTQTQIRNALEQSVQLQQSLMYFGNPQINSQMFERQLEGEDAAFKESEHPRGNPENAGEFTSGGGGSAAAPAKKAPGAASAHLSPAPTSRESWPEHIKKLVLPPAWKNVRISPDPEANLLAQGQDAKGKWQSIYHPRFKAGQAQAKFARIKELDSKFETIKQQNEANRAQGDEYIRQHADITALIMGMGIRPGSERDTGSKLQAFGATTLLGKHLIRLKSGPRLRFTGKDGVSLDLTVDDPKIAKMLERRADKAGSSGQLFPSVSDSTLRDYVAKFGEFHPKDIRTLLGTKTAIAEVHKAAAPTTPAEYKKAVKAVATTVSQKLGNTPTIALQSYIDPSAWQEWKASAGVP